MTRNKPGVRREQILMTAYRLACNGIHHRLITRKMVAEALGVTPPLVSHYFVKQRLLQDEVYRLAISLEAVEIVAQRIPPGGALSENLKKKLSTYLRRTIK